MKLNDSISKLFFKLKLLQLKEMANYTILATEYVCNSESENDRSFRDVN